MSLTASFSHQADGLTWLEVFQVGTRPDSSGRTFTITAKQIDQANAEYNPDKFRAPLIISHDTKGVPDEKLADSELAYGYPERFKRVGKRVYAGFKRIVKQALDWISEGRIIDRSASFYIKDGNPRWRHIALLGKSNPAVQGMERMQLSEAASFAEELGLAETIAAFATESDDDHIDFSFPVEAEPMTTTATATPITQADLDQFKAEFMAMLKPKGKSTKKKSDPGDDEDDDDDTEEDGDDTEELPPAAKRRTRKKVSMSEPETKETPTVDVSQYTEQINALTTENAALKAQVEELTPQQAPQPTAREQKFEALIALQESELLKGEIETCLKDNRERVTPGLRNKQTVSYSERSYNADLAEFTEEEKSKDWALPNFMERVAKGRTDRSDYEGFKHWLGLLPKQVDLSERSVVPNGDVDAPKPISPEDLAQKAKALVSERQKNGIALSYSEALDEIISTANLA